MSSGEECVCVCTLARWLARSLAVLVRRDAQSVCAAHHEKPVRTQKRKTLMQEARAPNIVSSRSLTSELERLDALSHQQGGLRRGFAGDGAGAESGAGLLPFALRAPKITLLEAVHLPALLALAQPFPRGPSGCGRRRPRGALTRGIDGASRPRRRTDEDQLARRSLGGKRERERTLVK